MDRYSLSTYRYANNGLNRKTIDSHVCVACPTNINPFYDICTHKLSMIGALSVLISCP